MGRFKKEVKKEPKVIIENKKEEEKTEPVQADESIQKNLEQERLRSELAKLDTDKANKDILLKNAKEIHQHIEDSREELGRVNTEIEGKHKTLKYLDEEIQAQNYNLSRKKEKFEKDNADQIRDLEVKQSQIDKADAEYKKLLAEVNDIKRSLSNDRQSIADERKLNQGELARMQKHVSDIESEVSKNTADVAEREEKLKAAVEDFKAEKESLGPELTRISSIKNENTLLLQKIEAEKQQAEHQASLMEAHKAKLEFDSEAGRQELARQTLAVKTLEAKLRKWEEDLNDQALELKAKEAEVEKARKRYELKKTVDAID